MGGSLCLIVASDGFSRLQRKLLCYDGNLGLLGVAVVPPLGLWWGLCGVGSSLLSVLGVPH